MKHVNGTTCWASSVIKKLGLAKRWLTLRRGVGLHGVLNSLLSHGGTQNRQADEHESVCGGLWNRRR